MCCRITGRRQVKACRATLLFGVAALCFGCALPVPTPPRLVRSILPPLRETATAAVGAVLISHEDYVAQGGVKVLPGFDTPVSLGFQRVIVPTGTVLPQASIGDERCYISESPVVFAMRAPVQHPACFFDRDGDGRLETLRFVDGWANYLSIPPAKVEPVDRMLTGFRQELLYEGRDENTIRVLYRQYLDSLIRPAFQQELTYTLDDAGHTRARFRDAVLEVESADNESIRYRVISGFAPEKPTR
jgi:hypothetical protein